MIIFLLIVAVVLLIIIASALVPDVMNDLGTIAGYLGLAAVALGVLGGAIMAVIVFVPWSEFTGLGIGLSIFGALVVIGTIGQIFE